MNIKANIRILKALLRKEVKLMRRNPTRDACNGNVAVAVGGHIGC